MPYEYTNRYCESVDFDFQFGSFLTPDVFMWLCIYSRLSFNTRVKSCLFRVIQVVKTESSFMNTIQLGNTKTIHYRSL